MEYVWIYILLLRITWVVYVGSLCLQVLFPLCQDTHIRMAITSFYTVHYQNQQNSPCWLCQGDKIFEASCYCQSSLQIHYLIHTCLSDFPLNASVDLASGPLRSFHRANASISDTQMFTFKCRHQRKVTTPNISNIFSFSIVMALKKL